MRHSSENIQQQRPFTTIATTTSTNVNNKSNVESYDFNNSSCNSNNDTISSLLDSHKYSVNNKNLNINRSVSTPASGKLGRGLNVASVNALYNEYFSNNNFYENSKTNSAILCETNNTERDSSMNRINSSGKSYNEKRKATPIPDSSNSSVSKKLDKHESLMEDLDDIIESPKIIRRYPKSNETNIWINTSTASDETVAADSSDRHSSVLMGQKSTDRYCV